jgi:hypothetical protein
LSDIERIKSAHDIRFEAPDTQKVRALLGGLLLSRAQRWIVERTFAWISHNRRLARDFERYA